MTKDKTVQGHAPVVIALIVNSFLTLIKFVGFFLSGSGAMFSEAVHSLADAGNQFLLLVGLKRSQVEADDKHHYGHGQERFFWALVSACSVFFVGCGITVYHGVSSLFHKEVPEINWVTFVILGASFIGESYSFKKAVDEIKHHSRKTVMQALKSGDPTTLAILMEDGAGIIGVILATIGIYVTWLTDWYWVDSLVSILIGLMLGGIAIKLINMNRKYLIEMAMPKEIEDEMVKVLLDTGKVTSVYAIRSSMMDIDKYRVRCKVMLSDDELAAGCDSVCEAANFLAQEINFLSDEVKKALPGIKHLDIGLGQKTV